MNMTDMVRLGYNFFMKIEELVARGILTPPLKKRPPSDRWPELPGNVSDETMDRVWREERDNR